MPLPTDGTRRSGGSTTAAITSRVLTNARSSRRRKTGAQAEALNALLLFSRIFPKERYYSFFLKQLDYVRRYIIDHENGDWFEGGIDKEPQLKTGPKSQMWKCTYHTGRALMNCITMLDDGTAKEMGDGFAEKKKEWGEFIGHWKETARRLPA